MDKEFKEIVIKGLGLILVVISQLLKQNGSFSTRMQVEEYLETITKLAEKEIESFKK